MIFIYFQVFASVLQKERQVDKSIMTGLAMGIRCCLSIFMKFSADHDPKYILMFMVGEIGIYSTNDTVKLLSLIHINQHIYCQSPVVNLDY